MMISCLFYFRINIVKLIKESFGVEAARFGLFVSLYFSTFKVSEKIISHWRNGRAGSRDNIKNPSSSNLSLNNSTNNSIITCKQSKVKDRWSPLAAGAIASLSLFVMRSDESFRWSLAQYLAVRATQCLYNHFITKNPQWKSSFYYGDVVIFSLSSAQLLYGFFVRRETLDPEYLNFLQKLTGTPPEILHELGNNLRSSLTAVSGYELLNLALILENVHEISPHLLPLEISTPLIANESLNHFPCSAFHFGETCLKRIGSVWMFIFKNATPMYFSLHFVPSLLFKYKTFLKEYNTIYIDFINVFYFYLLLFSPMSQFLHTVRNTLQSSSFLATCGAIYQSLLCGSREIFRQNNNTDIKLLKHDWKYYYWLIGLISGLGIFIEKKPRRSELALYVLPKALQALYRAMLSRRWMIKIPRGDFVLFSVSMSVLMSYYRMEPESVTPLVAKILHKFL